ncbi:hypothetical protein CCACVL1_19544, partial [Corchorus capsularis]
GRKECLASSLVFGFVALAKRRGLKDS